MTRQARKAGVPSISRAASGAAQPAAPVVAQRLCDLLLAFPACAASGVQWQVLVRKYEERFGSRLDLAALGHSSPLAAATTLLWDVLRLVDSEDTDNPVLAVEDDVALTAQPGQLGRWPSIYSALCEIVSAHGALETDGSCSILLSQVRPLLERHWHASFDESALGFRNEDGTYLRLKKMKHLLHAVLRWREQRQAWQRANHAGFTAVDEVLAPTLELAPSNRHNDLVLRCVGSPQEQNSGSAVAPLRSSSVQSSEVPRSRFACASDAEVGDSVHDLRREVELLRGENASLRTSNKLLELGSEAMMSSPVMMSPSGITADELVTPQLPADLFDDPFEPPPQAQSWTWQQAFATSHKLSADFSSTDAGSECSFDTKSLSSMISSSEATSGTMTPVHAVPMHQQGCALVPMWFPVMSSSANIFDACVIPRGIVQSACAQFERLAGQ